MNPEDRAVLARRAYEQALRAARSLPTRAAWTRLVRAGKNLREALDDAAARQASIVPGRA